MTVCRFKRGLAKKRGVDNPMHTVDSEFGAVEKKDELKFLMTVKSIDCFMRKLRFIGDRIQAV